MNTRHDVWYNEGDCSDDNNGTAPRGTSGIYAYIQVGRDVKSGTNIYETTISDRRNASWVYPISAEGNFDFNYRFDLTQPAIDSLCGNWGNPNIPIDKSTSLPNPFTGHSDLYNIPTPLNTPTIIPNPILPAGFSEVVNGIVVHNYNSSGDWEDAFTDVVGYNKIALGTNPAPTPVHTLYTSYFGHTVASNQSNINNTIWLNGIAIEILDFVGNDAYLKITWNNFDIDNNVRWCGNIKLQNDVNDPTNTISRINLKSGNTILLDQGTAAQRINGWLQPNGTYLFANPTLFTLENGTITTIETGSELKVVNGSSLHIKAGATIIVKGTGKVTIDSSAFICVEPGANIILQDVQSELLVDNDASIGINPILNISGNCSKLCDIQTLIITGNGFMTHQNLADAGVDQTICNTIGNNTIGGNPTAKTTIGTVGYTYLWSPSTGLDNNSIANPTITNNLTANTVYTVTVTDTNGCMGQDSILLIYNPLATNTISSTSVFCVGVGTDDGTATVTPGCGNPANYTYLWNDPSSQTTQTATGLEPGIYNVLVTDANGDTITNSVTVNIAPTTPSSYDFINPVITTDVTIFSALVKVKGEVRVKNGGILRIKNGAVVEFSYDTIIDFNLPYGRARLTIEQGGKVFIDEDVVLTGCGGGIWDGIEIWGIPDSLQSNNIQGYLSLKNSTLENAITGIQAWRTPLDNVVMSPTFGGIIDVYNTTFKNNRRAIFLRDYPSLSESKVITSNFIYDGSSFFSYPTDEMEFIRIANMTMAHYKLLNNQFYTEPTDFTEEERGVGIKVIDADVFIDGLGLLALVQSSFNNLKIAIDIAATNPLRIVDIEQYSFINCSNGIYIKGINGASIVNNNFTIPVSTTDTTYGIYMLETNMYEIEENTFNGTPASNTVGLYIYNTDVANNTQTNQVYRNTFNNLGYASFGNGINSNIGDPAKGLTFKCNTYVGNDFDILTTVAPGISIQQGSGLNSTTPAGNKFTDACGAITDGELLNVAVVGTQPNSYQYWYHNTPTYIPDAGCYTPFQVQPNDAAVPFVPSGISESCPTNNPCQCQGCCKDSLQQVMGNNLATIGLLNNTLDGGITHELLMEIQQHTLSTGELNNLLTQNSPLSSAVLIALVNSSYSSGTIKEVLLQNSPLGNLVLYALLSRQPQLSAGIVKDILQQSAPLASEIMTLALNNNYPGGITNQLLNNQQNIPLPPSVTQVTEAGISELTRENRLLINWLVRLFLHDVEDEYRFDSISVLLKTGGTPPPCRTCALEADVRAKNYTAALQEISVLEQQGTELEFASLQRALMDMETLPDKLMSVKTDTVLKAKIETVAAQTTKKGSINARNLLDMAFKQKVKETYHFPQQGTNSNAKVFNNNEPTIEETAKVPFGDLESFNLYPNPNQGIFTLAYLIADEEQLTLQLINLTGKIVYQTNLISTSNLVKLNTSFLSEGFYFLIVKNNQHTILFNTKVGIIK